MSTVTTKDGTTIYYKDWGTGQPIVFSHGWPLSSDDWDAQMQYFGEHGYRCIAHDRRGHGRSTQTWDGNDMDTYADDLMTLVEALDLKNAIHVGHSTGGGEVARYIGRHGAGRAKGRVAKAVLLDAVPPLMLKTAANPGGLPIDVFDGFRAAHRADRAQFFLDVAHRTVLRLQSARREGLGGTDQKLVAARHDGRRQGQLRLHQGLLRNRFHGGSEEVRRAHADHPRRRRSDRPDRRLRDDLVQAGQRRAS